MGTPIAGALAGGLGLMLLGLWMWADGLALPGGSLLRAHLFAWTRTRGRALVSGVVGSLLVPSTASSTAGCVGLVSCGLVGSRHASWLATGLSLGPAVTAWLLVGVAQSAQLDALGLAYIGAGVALAVTGPGTFRAAWGGALAGLGLLFLGLLWLRTGLAATGRGFRLDPFDAQFLVTLPAAMAVGAAVAAVLRSAGAAIALFLVAAASDAVGLPIAAALALGAQLGGALPAALHLFGGVPAARRVSAVLIGHALVSSAIGFAVLVWRLPVIATARPGDPLVPLACLLTIGWLGATALYALVEPRASRVLERKTLVSLAEEERTPRLSAATLAIPAIALEALLLEVREVADLSRRLAARVLGMARLSAQRRRRDLVLARARTAEIEHRVVELSRARITMETSAALLQVPRAAALWSELSELLIDLDVWDRAREDVLAPPLRVRLRQLQAAALHLIEGADPTSTTFDEQRWAGELQAVVERANELRTRLFSECHVRTLASEEADRIVARVEGIARAARLSIEAAAALQRAHYPRMAEEPEAALEAVPAAAY